MFGANHQHSQAPGGVVVRERGRDIVDDPVAQPSNLIGSDAKVSPVRRPELVQSRRVAIAQATDSPAHGALGAFFTATSMIGFMAGGGIVVRNSIILVDFIEQRLREGMPLSEAVIDAGAVRFRPMLLTALAVIAGAGVILADPIFQGLAISLMAGEIASLLISRMAVPVLYFMANRKSHPEA